MAQNATVFKAQLNIANMDRHYYADHALTLALHPSETEERMMIRLLGFIMHASERLDFTRGLCADDEPDLWQKSYSDEIELWIDVGLPSDKRVRKACNRAQQVVIITYGTDQAINPWLTSIQSEISRQNNLTIVRIPVEQSRALTRLITRNMQLQSNIQDGQIWITGDEGNVDITPEWIVSAGL
ncbi:YaeQ family protein [Pontibacter sp. JAM-7]|uniref:YaeQ family protein n=1 Tax=Pontibacter sp. JAM-7 TaxID=3366581 RepID=UPI003AF47C31